MEYVRYVKRGRGLAGRDRSHYFTEKKRKPDRPQLEQIPHQSLEGWILFVTNLHEETSEDDIKEAFSEYGEVKNINLNLDRRTGFVKGYALVEYEAYEEANTARECMNDSELLGVTIRVNWCFTKPDKNLL